MAIRELKVCLLGDTGVGKSSIVCRFVQDHFDHNISPTIGASFLTKTVPCGHELHKFLIWDTAGQERFHSLAPMYYRGSAAAVIVYDITKLDSFQTLKKWVKELKEHGPEDIVVAIAGNKNDLGDIREVPMKEAKEFAESIAAIFIETSARNAVNIEELFQKISTFPVFTLGYCSWSARSVHQEVLLVQYRPCLVGVLHWALQSPPGQHMLVQNQSHSCSSQHGGDTGQMQL
ncbi:hypothetical protein fugu_014724 [Takifugu bimaculatus]|uniref:RAB31, member RAS oncogene family n=1 Tax=Takifugu bimaculatus TaxID=433685 RepID=A0A4Z2C382_9TELE|nr:hypothetical protein fugu_014724 [Takifugu bimaculatus]